MTEVTGKMTRKSPFFLGFYTDFFFQQGADLAGTCQSLGSACGTHFSYSLQTTMSHDSSFHFCFCPTYAATCYQVYIPANMDQGPQRQVMPFSGLDVTQNMLFMFSNSGFSVE